MTRLFIIKKCAYQETMHILMKYSKIFISYIYNYKVGNTGQVTSSTLPTTDISKVLGKSRNS